MAAVGSAWDSRGSCITRYRAAMSALHQPLVPSRPATQWPIGVRLRFRRDAHVEPGCESLRGTGVIVLSGMRLIGAPANAVRLSWRQEVLAFGRGCKVGWARPDQLELPPDDLDPDAV
jgi:hypothetical protein